MPVSTPSWTTNDGVVHNQYIDALKHELALFFVKGVKGEALVAMKKTIEGVSGEQFEWLLDHVGKMVQEMKTPAEFRIVSIEPSPVAAAAVEAPPSGNNIVKIEAGASGTGEVRVFDDNEQAA